MGLDAACIALFNHGDRLRRSSISIWIISSISHNLCMSMILNTWCREARCLLHQYTSASVLLNLFHSSDHLLPWRQCVGNFSSISGKVSTMPAGKHNLVGSIDSSLICMCYITQLRMSYAIPHIALFCYICFTHAKALLAISIPCSSRISKTSSLILLVFRLSSSSSDGLTAPVIYTGDTTR